jgi:hypothetical protein
MKSKAFERTKQRIIVGRPVGALFLGDGVSGL